MYVEYFQDSEFTLMNTFHGVYYTVWHGYKLFKGYMFDVIRNVFYRGWEVSSPFYSV